MREFLEINNLLTDFQYGFREKRSTTDAICSILEQLYTNFNERQLTQGVFLDFSKAFDTINHELLLKKLPYYKFSTSACKLIKNYLTNRKQYVCIDQETSKLSSVQIGVPQGSVLGPLLFLIFINDLINCAPELNYILFADDTNIFSPDHKIMQLKLPDIVEWCEANRLVINIDKTFLILFKTPQKQLNELDFQLKMYNSYLQQKASTKFLGITVDSSLNFKQHLQDLSRNLNHANMIMRSLRPFVNNKTMIDLNMLSFTHT